MIGLTQNENRLLSLWNSMSPEKKKEAIALYNRISGDEPELMGIFPLFAALIPVAKKAFKIGKGIFKGAKKVIKKAPTLQPVVPVTKTKIPPLALMGAGTLLLLLLLRK